MMSAEELRRYLEFNNIDCTDYTDEDLEYLIEQKLGEIQSLTGVPIYPTEHTYISRRFCDDYVILPHYPLLSIESMQFNGATVEDEEYYTNDETGIIYFHKPHKGLLQIEYTVQLKESTINSLINPLLQDMVVYELGKDSSTDATSIKEGDVSISYDPSLSLGASIQKQLDNLRNYTVRVKWL